jgi:uncharacterized membrane protein YgcG
LSRLRILAIFATLAALTTVLAACGAGGDSDDPQAVIESATLKGVTSGNVDLSLQVESQGTEGANLDVSLSGPFQREGKEVLPLLDLEATAKGTSSGKAIDFDGGLTVLPDRAFVAYEGTEYELDPTTFGFVKSGLEQAQQGSGNDAGNPAACQEAVGEVDVSEFVEGLKDEGSADVEGTSTTKLSGELKAGSAIDALIALTEDPACRTQLEAAGDVPLDELEKARDEVSGALKKSHVELYVGDDDIIRKLAAELTISPKGMETVEIDLELSLGEVNEPQEIAAPTGAKPIEILFRKLDIDPLELLEAATSGEGFGDLLEGLNSDSKGESGSSGGEGSGSGGSTGPGGSTEPAGGGQEAYLECLQNAQTPTDLQNCASL